MNEPSPDVAHSDRPQTLPHRLDQAIHRPRRRRPQGDLELGEQPLDVPAIMPSKSAIGWPGSE